MNLLSPSYRAVVEGSTTASIATAGADGPHLAACLTKNVCILGYEDGCIRIPIWRLDRTSANLAADPRIELLFVAMDFQRQNGAQGQGITLRGTASVHREGPEAAAAIQKLPWCQGVIVVKVDAAALHLP